ncbi:homocysteine S-methyltransferase family protein [Roseovarius sp. SCSIO 43702]|uniref:homocysteine S-methyltransferase family protein n=1 Tax=Roseovarius sp. SCSIO 43702 TaxID=2823043 RepID=UPI0021759324|nr:homocysteine S-methyltransferase family protein [Roseovarius sp. SCSIO 43702]
MDTLKNTDRFYLSDGGLETWMVFEEGFDLPCFSAAVLLDTAEGRAALTAYFERFIALARDSGRGFVMDTPTWRCGAAWAAPLGLGLHETLAINGRATAFMAAIRDRHETAQLPILLNGLVGPAGDAYAPDVALGPDEACLVHTPQVRALAAAGVDMISAMTLTHAGEAAGIAQAAAEIDLPVVISFTLETDGRLPSGEPLDEAIAEVDAWTGAAPLHYMINCAHPDHFRDVVANPAPWLDRIGGVRANASRMSHAELDASEVLDDGDPVELGALHGDLLRLLPNLRIIGGCCGTDHRHVGCIAGHAHRRRAA